MKDFYQQSWNYIVFHFETYKVDIGGSFDSIRLVTRGRYNHQKIKTNVCNGCIFTRPPPPWLLWGSRGQEEPPKFDFLGWECNPPVLKQSEVKNLSKMAVFNTFVCFFRGFWLLIALNQKGCIPNLEN